MGTQIDIRNLKFGKLTAIQPLFKDRFGHWIWECKCECGNTKNILVDNLLRNLTRSCGCFRIEVSENRIIHGFAKGTTRGVKVMTEYRSWASLKSRCNNPNNRKYIDYGGRGIIVCERWSVSFKNFIEDMGLKPSPQHTIDRINNDGNYEPSNCRWATKVEQSKNRRSNRWLEYKGERKLISEWALFFSISESSINEKLKYSSTQNTFEFYYNKKLSRDF